MPALTPDQIRVQREREDLATTQERDRQDQLSSIEFTKRKTLEANAVSKVAATLNKLLHVYDLAVVPPELAVGAQSLFDNCVERLTELAATKPA